MRKHLGWLLPVAALPFLLLLLYGVARDPAGPETTMVGLEAPEFRLETMAEQDSIALSSLRGRVVVLNFFASWCLPCIDEHPVLARLDDSYPEDEVVLLGVLYQDRAENGRAFMERMGGAWPSVIDAGSRVAISYGLTGVPETFILDRQGRIAYKRIGPVSWPAVRATVDSLLALPVGVAGR